MKPIRRNLGKFDGQAGAPPRRAATDEPTRAAAKRSSAFTLVEVLMAIGATAALAGSLMVGYVLAAQRTEWSAYSLAAQSLAVQRLEQCRSTKWDLLGYPPVDMLVSSNFPVQINTLDIPIAGTNVTFATSVTTIATISLNPPLKQIRIDCSWSFLGRGIFTNTIVTYRAPDQ